MRRLAREIHAELPMAEVKEAVVRARWKSMDVKFPALMTGIVLSISVVFLWSARRQFGGVLVQTSGARLASSATLIAGMIGEGIPAARTQGATLAGLDAVHALLMNGHDSAAVTRAIRATITQGADSTHLRVRVLDIHGETRHVVPLSNAPLAEGWAEDAARRGQLPTARLSFSPLLDAGGRAEYEVITPVHARNDGESHIGYVVETRVVRGRGAESVRRLIGTSTMLFGQPGAGVWSDLERVVPGPPTITQVDSVIQFDQSPRGAGVGVSRTIRGTPWVIWLQLSNEQVLAPVTDFIWRMAPIFLMVATLGAALAWWFSRRISRRVVQLTTNVDRVAAATASSVAVMEASVAPMSGDEIDRLERAFHLMSERARMQQQLETQLQQSQKLEAVGRLAGGIAHDFNNVLTVVTNFGEIIRADLPPGSSTLRDLDHILEASNRAARLTRQLLAFSRRQILQPVTLDVNEVVRASHRLLERLLPSHISIVLELDPTVSNVLADPLQIEQVLLNLAVNASDAMPSGGRLLFRTTMAELDASDLTADHHARPHVCLIVKDTGVGMDRETSSRIFEPFFTTKASGKGTGLGLATVHGIITQLGGRIWVYSEPGKGSTFKLYFPGAEGPAEPLNLAAARREMPRGVGNVLLVEDDPGTRAVTKRILERQGYAVIESTRAEDALARLTQDSASVRLVITDVMMPGMNGVDFARRVAAKWPSLPVLLMSGYSDAEVIDASDLLRMPFIEKPFTSASLLSAVADAIAVGATSANDAS